MPQHLSGKTQIVGLIGWPVSHSVSPAMHNAAFDALGLDWRYVPLPVDASNPARIRDAVRGLPALGLRGANVTVPHKQNVIPLLDELTPAAATIAAVNTIVVRDDGTLLGDNTDARGFIADLRDHAVDSAGRTVLMLGAGGSARAIAFGLAEAGAASIRILNRTATKAEELATTIGAQFPACRVAHGTLPDDVSAMAAAADLIVNTTSLGMSPNVETSPWPDGLGFDPAQTVYDLVYNPPQTRLLAKAATDGATAINGLGMLIWQGALAFELWTGSMPPVDIMRAAAEDAFGRRS